MNEVGRIILTIFTGTLVHPGPLFHILTSKAHNLCKLTFHKTKIIWSSYIIWWLITAAKKVTNCECLLQLHHENYCTLLRNPSRENKTAYIHRPQNWSMYVFFVTFSSLKINVKTLRSDFSFQCLCVMCLDHTSSNLIRCKLRKYLSYLSRVSDDTLLLYSKVNIC